MHLRRDLRNSSDQSHKNGYDGHVEKHVHSFLILLLPNHVVIEIEKRYDQKYGSYYHYYDLHWLKELYIIVIRYLAAAVSILVTKILHFYYNTKKVVCGFGVVVLWWWWWW